MTVPSFEFLGFAAVAALIFNLSQGQEWRQSVLLVANLAFLASFSQHLTDFIPFAGFLALGYCGIRARQSGMRHGLTVFVLAVLAVFVWLKRYAFVPPEILLPSPYVTLGLSYVFFRVMHLVVDARDPDLPRLDPLSYINYTLNFTALVSGPIQRYPDYAATQVTGRLPLTWAGAGGAIERIVVGFVKVMVVCVVLQSVQKDALALLSPSLSFWVRVQTGMVIAVCYPIYLYFNFSGYTDVVIGVARFFSLRLPENFDRPFAAGNFIDFWSRWHISLSQWLKSYVYTPLLMTLMRRFSSPRVEPFLAVFAFFFTFFLIGAWHGQTAVFLVFGVLQGLGVSVNKLYQILMAKRLGRKGYRALCGNPIYHAVARGMTFSWFAFTLFFFWSDFTQIANMADALGGTALAAVWGSVLVGATVVITLKEAVRTALLGIRWRQLPVLLSRYSRTVWVTCLLMLLVAATVVLNSPAPDIVYKGF